MAALRLAEVMTGRGAFAEAEELLTRRSPSQGAARILFQDRLGDAAALRGDSEKALEAYRQAETQARQDFPNYIPLLEFKIGALLAGVDVAKKDAAASEDRADAEPDSAAEEEGDAEEAVKTTRKRKIRNDARPICAGGMLALLCVTAALAAGGARWKTA